MARGEGAPRRLPRGQHRARLLAVRLLPRHLQLEPLRPSDVEDHLGARTGGGPRPRAGLARRRAPQDLRERRQDVPRLRPLLAELGRDPQARVPGHEGARGRASGHAVLPFREADGGGDPALHRPLHRLRRARAREVRRPDGGAPARARDRLPQAASGGAARHRVRRDAVRVHRLHRERVLRPLPGAGVRLDRPSLVALLPGRPRGGTHHRGRVPGGLPPLHLAVRLTLSLSSC